MEVCAEAAASSSSPSSCSSRPSVEEEVALKRKLEFGAPSKTEDEILAIYAAGSANAKSMDANVAMTGSSRDAISISESPSAVESSSETEAVQKKPGTAKPYFDPAEGCYIRLAEKGKVSRGLPVFAWLDSKMRSPFHLKCPTCGLLRILWVE